MLLLGKPPSSVQSHTRSRVLIRRHKHIKLRQTANNGDHNETARKKVSKQLFDCHCSSEENMPKKVYAHTTNAVCVSCQEHLKYSKVRILKKDKYPIAKMHIEKILHHLKKNGDPSSDMHICEICHKALSKGQLPHKATCLQYRKHAKPDNSPCVCCQRVFDKQHIRIVKLENYDSDNKHVKNIFSSSGIFSKQTVQIYICKPCHVPLSKGNLPRKAAFLHKRTTCVNMNIDLDNIQHKIPHVVEETFAVPTSDRPHAKEETSALSTSNTIQHKIPHAMEDTSAVPTSDRPHVMEETSPVPTSESYLSNRQKPNTEECVCCHRIFVSQKLQTVNICNYDHTNEHVQQVFNDCGILDHSSTVQLYICYSCHKTLAKGQLPRKAAISPYKKFCGEYKCCICNKIHKEYRSFKMSNYNNTSYVLEKISKYQQSSMIYGEQSIMICDACNHLLHGHDFHDCSKCEIQYQARNMVKQKQIWTCVQCLRRTKKISSHDSDLQCAKCLINLTKDNSICIKHTNYDTKILEPLLLLDSKNSYFCEICHMDSLTLCPICERRINHNKCIAFEFANYDYSHYIVSKILSYEHIGLGIDTSLCRSCHVSLQYTNTAMPHIPRGAKHKFKHLLSCELFLQKAQEAPTFGCTVCHRWLFKSRVILFHECNYDMTDNIVAKCLNHRFVTGCHLGINNSGLQRIQREYICQCCHWALKQKASTRKSSISRMPRQAVANDLQLENIPSELQDITDLERRLISLRIPFMKLCSLRKYGSQFKIHGPCVNVPATLKHITTVLPRMSAEMELYPVVLKRRIDHSSEYMRNDIRREKVAGMINWLTTHNPGYSSIIINHKWTESFTSEYVIADEVEYVYSNVSFFHMYKKNVNI